jgi:hypothetical protein
MIRDPRVWIIVPSEKCQDRIDLANGDFPILLYQHFVKPNLEIHLIGRNSERKGEAPNYDKKSMPLWNEYSD